MAFTGTSLLSLPIITTGTESGAWGNITNNGLTQYLDTSIAGALSITSSITLANTSGDASGTNLASTTAQYRTLVVPASGPSANIVITAPSSNRTYHVVNRNATYTVQIRAGANSGVTLGVNQSATVTYNSTSADYELVGVVGASTATDNAVARFDGTTGEIIQNSGATIDDSANLSTTGTATATKLIPTGNVTAGNGMYLPAANTLAWSNNGSETMRIDSSGNVGIGTSSTTAKLDVVGSNVVVKSSASSGFGSFFANGATGSQSHYFFGINGTETARISSDANNYLVFSTGASATNVAIFDSDQMSVVAPTAKLGYGTGSGGTVTQATSKSTSVTLNKPTGQITMNNAALAAGAVATFVFNNSLIASADNIITTINFSANYRAWVFSVGSGTCSIAVKNESAGSLSEAVVINFAIIKGATA